MTRVNATDYDTIVIERDGYANDGTDLEWGVPAWDEIGHPALCGPFESIEQAEAALRAELEF